MTFACFSVQWLVFSEAAMATELSTEEYRRSLQYHFVLFQTQTVLKSYTICKLKSKNIFNDHAMKNKSNKSTDLMSNLLNCMDFIRRNYK